MPGSIDFGPGAANMMEGITGAFQQMAKADKEKKLYERQLAQVDAWTKQGVNQKTGQIEPIVDGVKNKDIIPFANQKALDSIRSSKTHSIAQKRGELDAYAAMVRMNIQNELRRAAKEPKTPVTVDGQTYNLTDAQRLQQQQNAAAGQRATEAGGRAERGIKIQEEQAKGTTPVQQKRFDMADAKEQRRILEAQPEYQFGKKHGITPAKIMENPYEDYTLYGTDPQGQRAAAGWNITRDPSGKLVGQGATRASAIMPPGYVPGKTKPEEVQAFQKQFFYEPNSPIYRVQKTPWSQTKEDGTAKQTVKGELYTPDPEGNTVHVHGQYMPMNEYQSMLQRANTMKQSYLNKITYDPNSGETPEAYQKRVDGLNQYMLQLGYDPKQFLGR